MRAVSGAKVSSEAVLVMGGITKVFVCEVIECARSVMEEWRESGPLRPSHLREVRFPSSPELFSAPMVFSLILCY